MLTCKYAFRVIFQDHTRARERSRFCSPTLFLRSARDPPSRRTRVLWEWLFWQARCKAVFPALERCKRREDTLAARFPADLPQASLAEGVTLREKNYGKKVTFSAS